MLTLAILTYAAAMTAANLILAGAIGKWGPSVIGIVSPINAFFLIGLDLALRDVLHVRLRWWQMLALIGSSGALTYLLNPAAGRIAVASACAFTAAALVDWAAFSRLRGAWLRRSNGSNIAGALGDSLVFPTIAAKALLPDVIAMQFAAKVAGGAVWAWALRRRGAVAAT